MLASALDRYFHLQANNTTLRTEVIAGLTTFVTMAYIIVVNPLVLAGPSSGTGMDFGAVMMATCLAAAGATLVMGLWVNYPFALAPGMGLNAFFAYGLCGAMGLPWQTALGVVCISGLCAVVVTATRMRETIIVAIPAHLKSAVAAGIGLFIAFIGFKNAGVIVASPATLVTLGPIGSAEALLALGGLIVTGILLVRRVTGAILIGMLAVTLVGVLVPGKEGTSITHFVPGALGIIDRPPSIAPGFLQLDLVGALQPSLFIAIFSLFFVDLFDTVGTFVGVAGRVGLIDADGRLKRGRQALFADSLGTLFGSLFGTSNTTTYVESAAGVNAGGRTGLTAVVVALCFLASILFAPLVRAVPAVATAPALIVVGVLMAASLAEIDWRDVFIALPAFLTILLMPLTFSIATGLACGFIAHVLLSLLCGRARQLHPFLIVLSALFVVYFAVQ
jgi:AGZA family xanthine/uracil permease-like MFS transporter